MNKLVLNPVTGNLDMVGITGSGVIGQVAEFVTDTGTIQAAKLIAPVANILTLTNTAAATLGIAVTAGKTLTLTAADNFNLTIPATGTAALLGVENVFTTGAVFNEAGNATGDLRAESDTEANMIFLDADGDTDGALYFGGSTNGIKINKGGEFTMLGDATVWDDLMVSVLASKLGGSKEPEFAKFKDNGAGSQGVFTYWFDKATEEEIYFNIQMPHSWKGSTIYPHVHWTPKVTADGTPANQTVEWGLEYTWIDIGGDFANTSIVYGNAQVPADANVVAGRHYLTELTTITPSATQDGISSMLVCRLFRNATDATDDTYESDAGLLQFDIHYEMDTIGSKTESAK